MPDDRFSPALRVARSRRRGAFERRLAGGDRFPAEIARHGIRIWPDA